jgi:uracil-DNA glycosylase
VQFINSATSAGEAVSFPYRLESVIGHKFRSERAGHHFDLIPLPHPSGASPWHKILPGRELTERALKLIARHSAIRKLNN